MIQEEFLPVYAAEAGGIETEIGRGQRPTQIAARKSIFQQTHSGNLGDDFARCNVALSAATLINFSGYLSANAQRTQPCPHKF